MNELHQNGLQVTEGGSGLHAEAQLLLKVTPKGNLQRQQTDLMKSFSSTAVI